MRAASILASIVVVLAVIAYAFTGPFPIQNHMTLGLDLKGGVYMVLQGVDSELGPVTDDAIDAAMKVVETRINKLGVSEPLIQKDGKGRILIQIAGETDVEKAREMVGRTAVLTFVDPEGKVVLDGKDIAKAGVQPDPNRPGAYEVTLQMKGEGTEKFAAATKKWINQQIAIKLDEDIVSNPRVDAEITSGQAVITGGFTAEEATKTAELINGGALPVKLVIAENRVVSATLGADSLVKSAKAGVIGMAFVVLFMVLVYRLPGLMANMALTIYAYITIAFLVAINSTFTLPGMAGLLLSIGMAVDANVIIFERIKEELRAGKGLRSGIDAGFHRAFSAVIDSNITTLIAGVILWFFGTASVKGFALTLSVGVCISLFTSITVTRWLLNGLVATGWFGKSLFGVKEVAKV